MIHVDVEQGSQAWAELRAGRPTASRFDSIITPKGDKSKSWDRYAHELIAEQILRAPLSSESSALMARGIDLESEAIAFYEYEREIDTRRGGFCLRDDQRAGCSPDRLVGDAGLCQIKCPSPGVHVGYLLDSDGIGYRPQVQGELWVCEREWSDTLSYCPGMPEALVRQHRDVEYIATLAQLVTQFSDYVDELKIKLQARGLFTGENIGRDLFARPNLKVVA